MYFVVRKFLKLIFMNRKLILIKLTHKIIPFEYIHSLVTTTNVHAENNIRNNTDTFIVFIEVIILMRFYFRKRKCTHGFKILCFPTDKMQTVFFLYCSYTIKTTLTRRLERSTGVRLRNLEAIVQGISNNGTNFCFVLQDIINLLVINSFKLGAVI